MATKRCPNCKLVNPASAARCDCGLSFVDGTMGEPLNPEPGDPADNRDWRNNRRLGWAIFGAGMGLLGIGLVLAALRTSVDAAGGFGVAGVVVVGAGRLVLKLT